MTQSTLLSNALSNFDDAARMLKGEVDEEILHKLRVPKERVELALVPKMEERKLRVFRAFVVRHSDALGPAKGGIRMTSSVTLDEVTGLAMEMTWKCALIGIPFGGGKSGIVADARTLSPFDKETIIRSFTRNAHRHIDPLLYIPAPDMGTDESDMGHLRDAISFSEGTSITRGCYVTGKPVVLGGIPGRREATGRGVMMCLRQAMKTLGLEMEKSTAVVQGFGNVGSTTALCLADAGMRVIAISDLNGAIHNPNGLNITALSAHAQRTGTVVGFDGAMPVDASTMLEMPCDVLVPAAAASQITARNAGHISCKIVIEGANSPTTPDGDHILNSRGITVVPDILANAGGVFVSYLEYTQETQQEQMTEHEVLARLQARMSDRFDLVYSASTQLKRPMRDAAMYLALKTVSSAVVARGLLP